jgi:hypothetical protein
MLDKEKRSVSSSLKANICKELQVFSVSNWGHLCLVSVSGLQVQLMLTYLIVHTVTNWNMAVGLSDKTTFKTTSRKKGRGGDCVGKMCLQLRVPVFSS